MKIMQKKLLCLAFGLVAFAVHSYGQTVTGTTFTPYPSDTFSDTGNTTPNYGLTWAFFPNAAGPSAMLSGYAGLNLYTNETRRLTITLNGAVGVGTQAPRTGFDVINGPTNSDGIVSDISAGTGDVNLVLGERASDGSNAGVLQVYSQGNSGNLGTVPYNLTLQPVGGMVGIGKTNPQAQLDVNGNVRISGSGAGLTFPDGSVQSTAYTGTCTAAGGDYAEAVNIRGDRVAYEPGDVLVIGSDVGSDIVKSSEPYSTMVAGIYSTKPGVIGRRQLPLGKMGPGEIPMAMVGIVPTKVSAENGAIHRGDLLVSAARPGYAMKGTDRSRMTGAILGKALGSLEAETGVIEVLVSLQ